MQGNYQLGMLNTVTYVVFITTNNKKRQSWAIYYILYLNAILDMKEEIKLE
jgi:hypothetical protein